MQLLELMVAVELGMIFGLAALGIYLAFDVINFSDLTCDGSFTLGGAIAAMLINSGFSSVGSLILAFLAGCLSGIFTGILHCFLGLNELLSGIMMSFMLYSINIRVMGGMPNVSIISENIFSGPESFLYIGCVVALILLALVYFIKSDFGLAITSIGQNKNLARSMGMSIYSFIIFTLALSNGLIALGGALLSENQLFADVSQGVGTVIFGLASITIGRALFSFRSLWARLVACVLGSIAYRIFVTFAVNSDVLGISTQDINLVTGVIVILIMLFRGKQHVGPRKY